MFVLESNHKKEYLSDLSKITRGAGVTLSGMIGGKGLLFFYTIFLARALGANNLGLYFLGIATVGFLVVLSNFGLATGVTRFVAIYSERNEIERVKGIVLSAAAITTILSLISTGATFLLADFAATTIFHKPEFSSVIKLFSLSIPFECLMRIFLASTRGLKFMQYTAYIENIAWTGLRFLFALLFLYGLGMGLQGIVLAYVASSMVSAVLALYHANKLIPLSNKKIVSVFESRKLLAFSTPMVFSSTIHNLMWQVDILMLGLFVSVAEVGIYSVVIRITTLAGVIFHVFRPIFQPFVAELHDKNNIARISKLLKAITRWAIIISFPIFLSLLFCPDFFISIFGSEFMRGSSCLYILVTAQLFSSVSGLTDSMIFMSGRPDITLKNNLGILTINILLNYMLIPKYGILGAATATGISLVLVALLRIIEIYYLMKIHPFTVDLLKPLLAGVISLAIILFLRDIFTTIGSTFLVILLSIFFLLYLSLTYLFILNKEDLYIFTIIKNKWSSSMEQRNDLV